MELDNVLSSLQLPARNSADIDTCHLLFELAQDGFHPENSGKFKFLLTRIEIGKYLYPGYDRNGRKSGTEPIKDTQWLSLTILLLLQYFTESGNRANAERLKACNALFHLMDLYCPEKLLPGTPLQEYMLSEWQSFLGTLPDSSPVKASDPIPESVPVTGDAVLPIIVLMYEGPIGRAYLETIRAMGLRPAKIIELVPERDIASGKKIGRWLPASIRSNYLASTMRSRMHYWPKILQRKYSALVAGIQAELHEQLGFSKQTLSAATRLLALDTYSADVEQVVFDGLRDQRLHDCLKQQDDLPILFTGGGLVPGSLLALKPERFVHVHPGFLPLVKGADCSLWSTLAYGRLSASCFYLANNIDTGSVIQAAWLPEMSFNLATGNMRPQNLYRMVYSYIDPWVRAYCLRQVLREYGKNTNYKAGLQEASAGHTFHFMHQRIKDEALQRLLGSI